MSRPTQLTASGGSEATVTLHDPIDARLLHLSGEQIDLMLYYLFIDTVRCEREDTILRVQLAEQQIKQRLLWFRPVERAIRSYLYVNDCRCSPFGYLLVTNVNLSGSVAEGLTIPSRPPNFQPRSDADAMFELEPVDWIYPVVDSATGVGQASATAADLTSQVSDEVPRLVIAATENPAFVLVLQERRHDCPHPERRPFKAEDVTRFLSLSTGLASPRTRHQHDITGPACPSCELSNETHTVMEFDEVPCLHVPAWWFSEEFFRRHREHNWPPQNVRDEIKRYGLHLVPVGAHGSSTEEIEWRLSFSRAEVLVSFCLTYMQRLTAILLKACKKTMGDEGKIIKSYYVKTALFWLCEQTGIDDWTSVTQGVSKLLDYLEHAVGTGNLPCFFWSRINLLRLVSADEQEALKTVLAKVRKHLKIYLAVEMVASFPFLRADLGNGNMSERQVRVYLVRKLITRSIAASIRIHMNMITADSSPVLRSLLRSYPPDSVRSVLRRYSPLYQVQTTLLDALTAAPLDVTRQVLGSLSGDSGSGFVLDATPLLGLLDEDDLRCLLGDPDAVRDWLRRQLQLPETERQSGLPADLRSPQELCDLLINVPLLAHVIEESVPSWSDDYRSLGADKEGIPKNRTRSSEEARQLPLPLAVQWRRPAVLLQSGLGVDCQKAQEMARRMGMEILQLLDDADTVAEDRKICTSLTDYWRLQPFWYAAPY